MDRFYTEGSRPDREVVLPEAEIHHARNVLRKRVDDPVEVFDGAGARALGVIVALERRRCVVALDGAWSVEPEPESRLVIATPLPKGDRARFLVEKATELGVDHLIPLDTTRSVVAPRGSKLDRLRQTVVAACKQCRRNRLLTIGEPRTWDEFLAATPRPLMIADPDGEDFGDDRPYAKLTIAFGPEGGFTLDELAAARDRGATTVALGRHVLRIETAVLAAAALFARRGAS